MKVCRHSGTVAEWTNAVNNHRFESCLSRINKKKDMKIPERILKRLAEDFRDWAVTRNPCDYEHSVEVDDGDDCWAFTIYANPVVRMVDGAPESDYPVVADANILEVTAEHYGYDSDVLTPLDGDAAEEYLERNVY